MNGEKPIKNNNMGKKYKEWMDNFDANAAKCAIIKWIRDWFEENGKDCNAVIGISGGKDSTIVAALCVEALGKDRVIGVQMPQGIQGDIDVADAVIEYLGIKSYECNILDAVRGVEESLFRGNVMMSRQAEINLPARIRMATLFAVAQSTNGRVSCNCNLSEDWIGFSTYLGDDVGSFAPIRSFTTDELIKIGYALGLPKKFVEKAPIDGLCGQTDEDNFGFTYKVLNEYIRTWVCEDEVVKKKIDEMHKNNLFKLRPMASFVYRFER